MAPNRDDIRREIVDAIEVVAGEDFSALEDEDRPITDLGLKSEHGVDFAGEIEIRFQIEIDPKINPFVDDEGKCARTLKEIVDLVVSIVDNQEEEGDE